MKEKIEQFKDRLKQVEVELGQINVVQDQSRYRKLSQEHAYLSEITELAAVIKRLEQEVIDSKSLLEDESDEEMIQMIEETISKDQKQIEQLRDKLQLLLVPPDPNDNKTTIVELRAGTGGKEAALFVADCVRMYQNFANQKGWGLEVLSLSPSDLGGFKEYIMALSGTGVHRYLQFEGGTHRVQRIPETETQGRVHTSTITIAIMTEPDENEDIELDEKDLRVDTYRSSGAGGQHVNTTDSAVRVTHIPTGIVAYCQEEKSQHKNKEKAMRLLKAKIVDERNQKAAQERSEMRSMQIGSGDRSERIRTYNFPQNRVTDHRINLTKHNLDEVMNGDLEEITSSLINFFHAKKLELA